MRVATPLHACCNDEALSSRHTLMVMACDEADTRRMMSVKVYWLSQTVMMGSDARHTVR